MIRAMVQQQHTTALITNDIILSITNDNFMILTTDLRVSSRILTHITSHFLRTGVELNQYNQISRQGANDLNVT